MEPPSTSLPHDMPSSGSPAPDLTSAIHLLDTEIQDIQTDEQRGGWNQWVILGAIGGLVWLLTGEIQTGLIDGRNLVRMLLTTLLLIDSATWFSLLLADESKPTSELRFRWSHSQFRSTRILPIFTFVRSLAILLLAFSSGLFQWHFLAPLSISYLTTALLMILLFIGSFTPLFAVTSVRNKWSYVFMGLAFVPMLIALAVLLPSLPFPTGNHISEYRIAWLISGTSFLVGLLLRVNTRSETVPLLKELRRKLIAGRIDPSNAIHEANIIAGGMQVADALKEDLLALLTLLEQIDEQTENAALAISSMEKNFPRANDDAQTTTEKLKTHAAIRENYISFLLQRGSLIEKHNKQVAAFYKKANRILGLPTAKSTIANIENLLKAKSMASDQLFEQLKEIEAEFDKRIGADSNPPDTPNKQVVSS